MGEFYFPLLIRGGDCDFVDYDHARYVLGHVLYLDVYRLSQVGSQIEAERIGFIANGCLRLKNGIARKVFYDFAVY